MWVYIGYTVMVNDCVLDTKSSAWLTGIEDGGGGKAWPLLTDDYSCQCYTAEAPVLAQRVKGCLAFYFAPVYAQSSAPTT